MIDPVPWIEALPEPPSHGYRSVPTVGVRMRIAERVTLINPNDIARIKMSKLSSRQRAYAAAYEKARHGNGSLPSPREYGLTKGNASYVEQRVREGRVDWSGLPEKIRTDNDTEDVA